MSIKFKTKLTLEIPWFALAIDNSGNLGSILVHSLPVQMCLQNVHHFFILLALLTCLHSFYTQTHIRNALIHFLFIVAIDDNGNLVWFWIAAFQWKYPHKVCTIFHMLTLPTCHYKFYTNNHIRNTIFFHLWFNVVMDSKVSVVTIQVVFLQHQYQFSIRVNVFHSTFTLIPKVILMLKKDNLHWRIWHQRGTSSKFLFWFAAFLYEYFHRTLNKLYYLDTNSMPVNFQTEINLGNTLEENHNIKLNNTRHIEFITFKQYS